MDKKEIDPNTTVYFEQHRIVPSDQLEEIIAILSKGREFD